MMSFNHAAYLDRIGLRQVSGGIDGLRAHQAAHMSSIPFENIDPLLSIVPSLAPADLQDKIVRRRCGGYCFELNALFGMALEEFGFRSTTVLARVRNGAPAGGARTHQCSIVHEGGRDWLVDVGFGGPGAVFPIALDESEPQAGPNGTYRVRFDAVFDETVIERAQSDDWHALFGFDRVPVRAVDLEAANHLAATWSKAPFSSHLMMARHGDGGRTTLFNRKFQESGRAARILAGADELADALAGGFGIAISEASVAALWEKINNAPLER